MADAGDPARRRRIITALADRPGVATQLCEVAAAVTAVSGAGIMVMSGDYPTGSICSSDAVSRALEDLQYELGEGPSVDAFASGEPMLVPDLVSSGARWPAFGEPAAAAGARAMFGFPLRVGTVRIGALSLYRTDAGDLNDEQHADAVVMADVAAHAVLLHQTKIAPGELGAALAGTDLHLVVHQAAGMVSVQLEIPIVSALVRLRARAFADSRPLTEVARAVVDRQLRFEE